MLPLNTMSSVYLSHSLSFPGHDDLGAELQSVTLWSTRASFMPDLTQMSGFRIGLRILPQGLAIRLEE